MRYSPLSPFPFPCPRPCNEDDARVRAYFPACNSYLQSLNADPNLPCGGESSAPLSRHRDPRIGPNRRELAKVEVPTELSQLRGQQVSPD